MNQKSTQHRARSIRTQLLPEPDIREYLGPPALDVLVRGVQSPPVLLEQVGKHDRGGTRYPLVTVYCDDQGQGVSRVRRYETIYVSHTAEALRLRLTTNLRALMVLNTLKCKVQHINIHA